MTIGELIRNFRLKNDMSQALLSELTGTSQGYMSRIEKGDAKPSVKVLKRIASVMRIDLKDLIDKATADDVILGAEDFNLHDKADRFISDLDLTFDVMILEDNTSTVSVNRLAKCLGVSDDAIRSAIRDGNLPGAFAFQGLGSSKQSNVILKAPLYHWWYSRQ
jgi:transcriptional regulator with XRE-family HTH domain